MSKFGTSTSGLELCDPHLLEDISTNELTLGAELGSLEHDRVSSCDGRDTCHQRQSNRCIPRRDYEAK